MRDASAVASVDEKPSCGFEEIHLRGGGLEEGEFKVLPTMLMLQGDTQITSAKHLSLVLQAPNKILYESYKVLHASYKEVWLSLGRNIVFQLATERTIFFSKQSQVCLEVIY